MVAPFFKAVLHHEPGACRECAGQSRRAEMSGSPVWSVAAAAGDDGGLKVQEIDAYWLQRRISQNLGEMEAAAAQRLAQEVFQALQVSSKQISLGTCICLAPCEVIEM